MLLFYIYKFGRHVQFHKFNFMLIIFVHLEVRSYFHAVYKLLLQYLLYKDWYKSDVISTFVLISSDSRCSRHTVFCGLRAVLIDYIQEDGEHLSSSKFSYRDSVYLYIDIK